MSRADRAAFRFIAIVIAIITGAGAAMAQQAQYPSPTELPNPYRLVEGWPTLPKTMNGGHWGEVIRVHLDRQGNIWVLNRCFNTVPPGHATCIGRGEANPPILEFDRSGKLLKSFGAGLFAYAHGFTIDGDGNLWASDVNDEAVVLGMPAKNADGVVMGQEVLKLSPTGKVLMVLGKEGVAGNGPDTFDRPTGIAVAPDGSIFVADGHYETKYGTARVVKFSKDGKFIKTWGRLGSALATSTSLTTFLLAAPRIVCTWPTAETSASRFSTRTATSSRRGSNSASRVRSLSARMTPSMWERHRPIRKTSKGW